MLLMPGHHVVVSLTDQTALNATSMFSWRSLRLRDVEYPSQHGTVQADGRVIIPPHAVMTVQVTD